MANDVTIFTKEGLEKINQEYEYLKSEKRQEVAEKIKVALSFGDLSENSEYDEAKNEQGIVEARINEIEAMLKNYKVLDSDDINTTHVQIGNTVVLENKKDGKRITLHIVGSKEVDIAKGKISDESPVGKAVMGHQNGDIVDVDAPAGMIKYEIVEIDK